MLRFLIIPLMLMISACAGMHVEDSANPDLNTERTSINLFARARIAQNDGNLNEALSLLNEAESIDPSSGHIKMAEAEIYLKMNQVSEALAALEKAMKSEPSYREPYLMAGTIMSTLGKDKEAIQYLRKAVSLDPSKEDAAIQLSTSLIRMFEYEEAVNVLKELVKAKPDSAAGYYYLGKAYSQMKLYRESLGYYRKAMDLRPDFQQAAIDRAVSLEGLGEYEQAIEAYKVLINDSESNPLLINRLIQVLIQQHRYEDALGYLEKLSAMGFGSNETKRKIGLIHLELGNSEKAIKIFSDLLAAMPESPHIRYYLASAYEENDELDKARTEFKKITKDSELYPDTLGHLAFISKEQGNEDEAVRILQNGIKEYPDRLELYLSLATLYDAMERDSEGLKLLLDVEKQFADDARIHFRIGVLYDKLNKRSESIKRMKRVIEITPRDPQALNYLGYTYAEMGIHLEEALSYIRRALEIQPDDGFFMDSLGWVYFKMRRYDEAVKYLEKASELVKDDPTILEHLGDAYLSRKEPRKAMKSYRKALELDAGKKEIAEKIRRLKKAEQVER